MDLMDDIKTFDGSVVGMDNVEVSIAFFEWFDLANLMEHIT